MPFDVSREASDGKRSVDEMIKLIRKLRWIGLKEEAEKAQLRLEQHAKPAGNMLPALRDTD